MLLSLLLLLIKIIRPGCVFQVPENLPVDHRRPVAPSGEQAVFYGCWWEDVSLVSRLSGTAAVDVEGTFVWPVFDVPIATTVIAT